MDQKAILIVDDDSSITSSLAAILHSDAVMLWTASTLEEAESQGIGNSGSIGSRLTLYTMPLYLLASQKKPESHFVTASATAEQTTLVRE